MTEKKYGGYFVSEEGGVKTGEVSYRNGEDNTIIIDHVGVNPKFRGQEVRKELVEEVIGFARENGLSIYPVCSYSRLVFERYPEYGDVLSDDYKI